MIKKIKFILILFGILISFFFIPSKYHSEIEHKLTLYLPIQISQIYKYIYDHQNTSNKIENNYKSRFLPITEFTYLDFFKSKIKFKTKYNLFDERHKIFFIDFYNDNLIFAEKEGTISYINSSILVKDKIKRFQDNQKIISTNLKVEEILDIHTYKNDLYVSFIDKPINNCRRLNLSKAEINFKKMNFKKLFSSTECRNVILAGKIATQLTSDNKFYLYLTTASDVITKGFEKDPKPQLDDNIWGKIIQFNDKFDEPKLFAKGFRNSLGIYLDSNGTMLATDMGPQGGDEINKIFERGNYGWDVASYGKKYKTKLEKLDYKDHEKNNFNEPIFSFIPSVGISSIIKIPNSFNSTWDNNFLIGTLNSKHLLRIKFDKNITKVLFVEKIFVGERIRNIKFDYNNNNIVFTMENTGSIGILSSNIKIENNTKTKTTYEILFQNKKN